jgi:N-acylneuraminate cytidylyltransferase
MVKPKILALIPARGGSKGLPGKNLRLLHGKPLIAYSILAARSSSLVDRVIVSTDDPRIAEVAVEYGAEVPFMRPKELATDSSSIGDTVDFSLQKLSDEFDYAPDYLVEMYPTSPFRTKALVDRLLGILLNGFTQVKTVKKVSAKNNFFHADSKNKVQMLKSGMGQLESGYYYRFYGVLNAWKVGAFGAPRRYMHVITNPAELIDIDYSDDFREAERMIEEGLFDPGVAW